MLVALKSPVKFSKCFFSVKFPTKFEVVQQKQLLSVVANQLNSDLYRKLSGIFNEKIRGVCSTEILSNTATIRDVNSTAFDFFLLKIVR